MNKIFTEKLISRIRLGLSENNRVLSDIGIKFVMRADKIEKSSPEPLNISLLFSWDTLKKESEIKAALENEIVHKQYISAIRMFKRSYSSIRKKDKKISITIEVPEYEKIVTGFNSLFNGYCGDIIFLNAKIYNPAYEALHLLSKF